MSIRISTFAFSALLVGVGVHSEVAQADDYCPSSPTDWDIEDCDGRCNLSGNTWTCNLSASTGSVLVVMVQGYGDAKDHDYSAWGHNNDGEEENPFCCNIADGDAKKGGITNFEIIGGYADDSIAFTWDSLSYNLQSAGYRAIEGLIQGGYGNDVIKGSDEDDAAYSEELDGEEAEDTIHANGGDDLVVGGDNDDTLNGDGGDDTMWGNAGDDIMRGGPGDDTMNGGTDEDRMSGNGGHDTMNGGHDADIMCGGDNNGDSLHAGDTDYENPGDILWGQHKGADLTCGGTGAYTDYESTSSLNDVCDGTVLGIQPGACP